MNEEKFRHEFKYLVSSSQVEILKNRANAILEKDKNVEKFLSENGIKKEGYNIRSVYFDDYENSAYWEVANGYDNREKFRIRIYNHSDDVIVLELKQKHSGKCLKERCYLTREQCEILLKGNSLPNDKTYDPILQKLNILIKTRRFHPVVIVEYDRIPYVYPLGHVRVTLDLNIKTSGQCEKFFEESLVFRPVMPINVHLFEVKWHEILPDFIYSSMMLENLRWDSFSKFYYCRHFLTDNTKCL